jgi:DnaJ-class molecular chaperone
MSCPGQGATFSRASCRPEPVPAGAAPEVARVLQAATWYDVLEVAPTATAEEVRKAHKTKSLLTHPDKVGSDDVGAHNASVRVNAVCLQLTIPDRWRRLAFPRTGHRGSDAVASSMQASAQWKRCRG